MLIAGFPAGPFGTNCWVVAPGAHSEAIIVDPGIECRDRSTRCSTSTGCARSRSCSRTATSTTRARSPRCAAPATSRRTSTPTTGPARRPVGWLSARRAGMFARIAGVLRRAVDVRHSPTATCEIAGLTSSPTTRPGTPGLGRVPAVDTTTSR